jgi:hypothetical protein
MLVLRCLFVFFRISLRALGYVDKGRSEQTVLEKIAFLVNLQNLALAVVLRLDASDRLVYVGIELESERLDFVETGFDQYVAELPVNDFNPLTESVISADIRSLECPFEIVEHRENFADELGAGMAYELTAFSLDPFPVVLELGMLTTDQIAHILELFRQSGHLIFHLTFGSVCGRVHRLDPCLFDLSGILRRLYLFLRRLGLVLGSGQLIVGRR